MSSPIWAFVKRFESLHVLASFFSPLQNLRVHSRKINNINVFPGVFFIRNAIFRQCSTFTIMSKGTSIVHNDTPHKECYLFMQRIFCRYIYNVNPWFQNFLSWGLNPWLFFCFCFFLQWKDFCVCFLGLSGNQLCFGNTDYSDDSSNSEMDYIQNKRSESKWKIVCNW